MEEQIRDQVINKFYSSLAMEESEKQARSIEGASDASNEANSAGGKVDHKELTRAQGMSLLWKCGTQS